MTLYPSLKPLTPNPKPTLKEAAPKGLVRCSTYNLRQLKAAFKKEKS